MESNVTSLITEMKQETDYEAGRNVEANVTSLFAEIKQETDVKECYWNCFSKDPNINSQTVAGISRKRLGEDKLKQSDIWRNEGDHSCNQRSRLYSSVDIPDLKIMNNFIKSEPMQNTAFIQVLPEFTQKIVSEMKAATLNTDNNIESGLKEVQSPNVTDSEIMTVDMNLTPEIYTAVLQNENCSRKSTIIYEDCTVNIGSSEAFKLRGGVQSDEIIGTKEKLFSCSVCGVQFSKKGDHNEHELSHMREKCYISRNDYPKKATVQHNGETHYKYDVNGAEFCQSDHKVTETERESYMCDELTGRKLYLNWYKILHTEEKSYTCNICGAEFSQNYALYSHKRTHTGEKPYKCDVCGAEFSRNDNLKSHKRTHTGEKPYKCDVCEAEFSHSRSLKSHKRMHTGEKPYMCDVCGAEFSHSGALKSHKRTHTEEKPYKCDVCGAEFSRNGHLKSHKRTHTGEKPYKCDVCGAEFSHSGALKIHKRTHTGEKPYMCDVCGVRFVQDTTLRRHKRRHTGEKPYRCDLCGDAFSHQTQIKRHVLKHIGEKMYKCDVC